MHFICTLSNCLQIVKRLKIKVLLLGDSGIRCLVYLVVLINVLVYQPLKGKPTQQSWKYLFTHWCYSPYFVNYETLFFNSTDSQYDIESLVGFLEKKCTYIYSLCVHVHADIHTYAEGYLVVTG